MLEQAQLRTGLPMVTLSGKLVSDRMKMIYHNKFGTNSKKLSLEFMVGEEQIIPFYLFKKN